MRRRGPTPRGRNPTEVGGMSDRRRMLRLGVASPAMRLHSPIMSQLLLQKWIAGVEFGQGCRHAGSTADAAARGAGCGTVSTWSHAAEMNASAWRRRSVRTIAQPGRLQRLSGRQLEGAMKVARPMGLRRSTSPTERVRPATSALITLSMLTRSAPICRASQAGSDRQAAGPFAVQGADSPPAWLPRCHGGPTAA